MIKRVVKMTFKTTPTIKKSQLRKYKRLGYSTHWCIILYVYNNYYYKLSSGIDTLGMINENVAWIKDKNKYIINLGRLL